MKVTHITDIDKFFEVIDSCKGRVELVTGEGDRLNLKSVLQKLFDQSCFSGTKETGDNINFNHFVYTPFNVV